MEVHLEVFQLDSELVGGAAVTPPEVPFAAVTADAFSAAVPLEFLDDLKLLSRLDVALRLQEAALTNIGAATDGCLDAFVG